MSKRKPVKLVHSGGEGYATSHPYPVPQPPAYPAPAPPDMHSVSISVLSSHGATVAKAVYASVYNTGIPVSASGEAKREPGDEYDRETGRLLATSRALEILAGKLRREANGRIRHADAIRRHHEEMKKHNMLARTKYLADAAARPAALDSAVRRKKNKKEKKRL